MQKINSDRFIARRQSNIFEHYQILKYEPTCNYTKILLNQQLGGRPTDRIFQYTSSITPLEDNRQYPKIKELVPVSFLEAPGIINDYHSHPIVTHGDILVVALELSCYHYVLSTKTATVLYNAGDVITCVDINKIDESIGIATRSGEIIVIKNLIKTLGKFTIF